jgi:hypothetical protein
MLYCRQPWLPNLTLLIELDRHTTQVLNERLAPEKKWKKSYSKNSVLRKHSLEWEFHQALSVNTEHSTPTSGDRTQSWIQGGEAEREVSQTE